MTFHAQYPAVARNIEPARRARYDVMALEFFAAAAALTAPAVPPQHKGPETPPAPRRAAPRRYSHVTSPLFEITAPRNATGAGRRACSPAASNKLCAASSLDRL